MLTLARSTSTTWYVAPAIAAMLAAPNGIDRAAADWLATRALILIRARGSAAPPAAVSAVVALFDDAAKPVDLRIRSAAVVGTMQAKEADPGKFVATVESLAGSLLQSVKFCGGQLSSQHSAGQSIGSN